MRNIKLAFAAPFTLLLLAACGQTAAENNAAQAEAGPLENGAAPGVAPANLSEGPADAPVPPPDAVSHPNGYLPNAGDVAPETGPEPNAANSSGAGGDQPATEDEYMRNRQSGS